MQEIEKACRELGYTCIFLLTENNVPAYEFYKRQGFYESETNVLFAKKIVIPSFFCNIHWTIPSFFCKTLIFSG